MLRFLRIIHYWFFLCTAVVIAGFGIIGGLITGNVNGALVFVVLGLISGGLAYLLRDKDPKPVQSSTSVKPKPVQSSTSVKPKPSGLNKDDFFIFKSLANQIIANDIVSLSEAQALQSFLYKNGGYEDDRTRHILTVINDVLSDGIIDSGESKELTTLLGELLDSIDKPVKPKKTKRKKKPVVTPRKAVITDNKSYSFSELTPRKSYFISYVDAQGDASEREIFITSIKTNKAGNEIVYARCKSANASRSFRLDRITEAVDIETGEVII